WASAGSVGFKGSKKNTPYAATKAAHQCAEEAMKRGLAEVIVRVTGLGNRKPPIRGLLERNLKITAIQDRTPVRHNGCRAPGKRHS
ncbi:MAG: 30S ribosomal protein S11, partial [Cytophagales bacterium]